LEKTKPLLYHHSVKNDKHRLTNKIRRSTENSHGWIFFNTKKKTNKKNKGELLFRANSPSFYFVGHAIHQLHNANDLFSSLDFVSFVLLSFRKNLSNNYFEQNLNILIYRLSQFYVRNTTGNTVWWKMRQGQIVVVRLSFSVSCQFTQFAFLQLKILE
jgi:hypothetical protein